MNILLADDHPMILDGYISILGSSDYNYLKAHNCEEVYHQLVRGYAPDVAVIDYSMPLFKTKGLNTGLDCTLLIRQYFPQCKIILITAHEQALILYNMCKKGALDALIVKADFNPAVFKSIVTEYLLEIPYYSFRVKEAIKLIINKSILLDSKNREILLYLSYGFNISQIENLVSLSSSAIQKRISKMLQEFKVSDYQQLILAVKACGFL